MIRLLLKPAEWLAQLSTLHLYVLTGLSVAFWLYMPERDYLIFFVCVFAAVSGFRTLKDVSSWFGEIDKSLVFLSKCIRDKDILS